MTDDARRYEIERHILGPNAPRATEAEKAVLGIALADGQALELIDGLSPHHFYEPLHGEVWAAIQRRFASGSFVDPNLLDGEFAANDVYREAGGVHWLQGLIDLAPGRSKAEAYADAIRAAAQRRAIAHLGEVVAADALKGEEAPGELLTALRNRADEIERDSGNADVSMVPAPVVARRAIQAMEETARHGKPKGLMTGLRCIDRRLNGLKPGALIVIGGRPGMGKTGLARAVLHGAAVRNPEFDFLFFGQEMTPDEMMARELSALTYESGIDAVEYRAMDAGTLTPLDLMAISSAEKKVPANLYFDERAWANSVPDIRRKIFARNRKRRVGAVVIDYLQLLKRPAAKGRNETTVIGEMTQLLKQTAQQAGMAIVLLSQLSRQVESREDKRPTPADLRESGSIEQDADVILFPFREHHYLIKAEPSRSDVAKYKAWEERCEAFRRRMDVICAKQRGGPEGTDRQLYYAEFDYIEDEPQ